MRIRVVARFGVGAGAKVNARAPDALGKASERKVWVKELCLPRIAHITGSTLVYPAPFSALPSASASQETVIQGMKTSTSSVPTAPSGSTTTHTTPAAASRVPATMGSAALSCRRQRRWCAITVPTGSRVRPPACWPCADTRNSREQSLGNYNYLGLL